MLGHLQCTIKILNLLKKPLQPNIKSPIYLLCLLQCTTVNILCTIAHQYFFGVVHSVVVEVKIDFDTKFSIVFVDALFSYVAES